MALLNSSLRYGVVARSLHWITVPLLGLTQIASLWAADRALAHRLTDVHEPMAHALMAMAAPRAATADTSRAADGS
jgi:cytochrome b561